MQRIHVTAEWDDQAGMWYVSECTLPGLVTEAPTAEALLEKIAAMAADLVEPDRTNGAREVPIDLVAHRASVVRFAA